MMQLDTLFGRSR